MMVADRRPPPPWKVIAERERVAAGGRPAPRSRAEVEAARSFRCDVCPRGFESAHALRTHQSIVHLARGKSREFETVVASSLRPGDTLVSDAGELDIAGVERSAMSVRLLTHGSSWLVRPTTRFVRVKRSHSIVMRPDLESGR